MLELLWLTWLSDMLNDFSAVKVDSQKPTDTPQAPPPSAEPTSAAAAANDSKPPPPPDAEDAFSEEEFAKQLQAGMADLLGELEKSVCTRSMMQSRCAGKANNSGTARYAGTV